MIDDNENLPDDIMLECIKDFSGNIGDFKNSEHLRRNIILNFSPSLQAKIIALPDHNKKRFILLSKNVDTEVLLHLLKTGNDGDKFEVINWLAYGTGSNHDWSNNSQQEIINYFLNNSDINTSKSGKKCTKRLMGSFSEAIRTKSRFRQR